MVLFVCGIRDVVLHTLHRLQQYFRWLRARHCQLLIKNEKWHAFDAESACAVVRFLDQLTEIAPFQTGVCAFCRQTSTRGQIHQGFAITQISPFKKKTGEQRFDHGILNAELFGKRDELMRVYGVRLYSNIVEAKIDASGLTSMCHTIIDPASTFWSAEFAGCVLAARHSVRRQMWIELERVPDNCGWLPVRILGSVERQKFFQVAFANETPRADYVGNDIDTHWQGYA